MRKFIYVIFVFFVFSCNEQTGIQEVKIDNKPTSDYLIAATVWYQQSAEMQAICYQTFNLAEKQLLVNAANCKTDLPKAVVVDIDETMLDNSFFEAYLIHNNESYNYDLWKKWVVNASAEPLAGAVDFTKFAKENNITVFYISNRHTDELEPTLQNLKQKDFAFAEEEYLLLKQETSDKSSRRDYVAENYEIIMLVGDNLRDFDEIYGKRGNDYGFNNVYANRELFGSLYFILPNPMYGEWEKAYNNAEGETSQEQKIENMKKSLSGF